ncbi:unnamed protein product, partial [Rotaria sordida]
NILFCIIIPKSFMASSNLISREKFRKIFRELDDAKSDKRFKALETASKEMGWQPSNKEEIAAFLGHVAHETDGLRTLTEYCGRNNSWHNYQQNNWSSIQPKPGNLYYGRGWFQLSYPANYAAAGQDLGLGDELWEKPWLVADDETLACKTAIWFWNKNGMGPLAANGEFGKTTYILNSWECTSDDGETLQKERIQRYQYARECYGLQPAPDTKAWCRIK